MTATFLLVRHAVTDDVDVRLSGRRAGVPLNAAGREQAVRLARRLAREPIDAIIASPLDRTHETAAAIATATAAPLTTDDALLEIDVGEWSGVSFATLSADPHWATWNARRATARCPGGESMAEVQARIAGAIVRVAAARPGQTVLLVTHSDLIRAAVCDVLRLGLDNIHRFDIQPASITRVVVGDWGGRLVSLNEGVG